MKAPKLVVVSDTEIRTADGIWEDRPEAWGPLLDWCTSHGLDPYAMPADNHIVRDVEHCRIEYDVIVRGEDGQPVIDRSALSVEVRRVHAQGETPPMPFPPEVLAVGREVRS